MKIPKIFLKIFGVIFILSAIYIAFAFFVLIPKIESNAIALEDTIGKAQLQKTVQLVQSYAQELQNYKETALQQRKGELKKLTDVVYSIIDVQYKKSLQNDANVTALQNEVLLLIKNLRYGNNDYFYVSNYQNILLSHPYLKKNIDFSNVKDIHGELIVPPLVAIARKKGEGFISYWWQKNSKNATPYEKLTYAKNFAPWKWVVGTGVYIDDIEKDVAARKKILIQKLKKILDSTKIGKNGYVYIFDDTGRMIIHQNKALEGKKFDHYPNPGKKTYIYDDLVNAYKSGKKILYYNWDAPNDRGHYVYKKISWIDYNPSFSWYICSSEYINEAHADSDNLKHYLVYSILFMLFVSLAIGLYFVKQIFQPIVTLSRNAQEVIDGNIQARYTDKIDKDEIGLLAQQYNTMLDKIKEQMDTLDSKVQEKTQKLTIALEEKEILLKEINHRVKNNLYVISSIVGLQAFQTKDVSLEDFIQTIQQRIHAMAIGHEMLSQSANLNSLNAQKYIPRLVQSLVEAYVEDPDSCNCIYDIDSVTLELDKLLACGLIVNELVTNAIKYALKTPQNYLLVALKQKDSILELVIEDNGEGFSPEYKSGVGLDLVTMLVEQLEGQIQIHPKDPTRITIIFSV
jgi:two-component sensor histidine kinase